MDGCLHFARRACPMGRGESDRIEEGARRSLSLATPLMTETRDRARGKKKKRRCKQAPSSRPLSFRQRRAAAWLFDSRGSTKGRLIAPAAVCVQAVAAFAHWLAPCLVSPERNQRRMLALPAWAPPPHALTDPPPHPTHLITHTHTHTHTTAASHGGAAPAREGRDGRGHEAEGGPRGAQGRAGGEEEPPRLAGGACLALPPVPCHVSCMPGS